MKLTVEREKLLAPLQAVIGVVERRQTMPVLANVLLGVSQGRLSITATDLEVELVAATDVSVQQAGDITVPGRKFLDILRALPEKSSISLAVEGEKVVIKAARSRFSLSTLPAAEFPVVEDINSQQTVEIPRKELARLLDKTHFSMAQQDVRYYLNGMLLEIDGPTLRAVATDGHRLALCEIVLEQPAKSAQQVIIPRKGVLELQRVLTDDGSAVVAIGTNHVRAQIGDIRFTSKLIDGRFPEYSRVIPAAPPAAIRADRDTLRQALQRTAILSNEKYRGIRINVKKSALTVQAHNPEQEEAEEEIEVAYEGADLEVGFNVNYLLDALAAIDGQEVELGLTDSNSSCLIRSPGTAGARYVVMPMRL
ncbi:MAG TPA: DNA polymerase III subunit beta [Steroidobacteraceae bacterium]|jgi:DNA polymerase-3 subunit beta|nr:DNA polymerase III subunit beta [Steroidobacteraceae bacterium]